MKLNVNFDLSEQEGESLIDNIATKYFSHEYEDINDLVNDAISDELNIGHTVEIDDQVLKHINVVLETARIFIQNNLK